MKSKMLIVLTVLMALPAWLNAGFVQPAPVVITDNGDGTGLAAGDMVSARASENTSEFIGCGQRVTEDGVGGVFHWGFCQAQLVDGAAYTCITTNPDLLDGIDSIADASYVIFSWTDDGTGNLTCTHIGSSTQSFYLAKQKGNF